MPTAARRFDVEAAVYWGIIAFLCGAISYRVAAKAQPVEQRVCTPMAAGSNPAGGSN